MASGDTRWTLWQWGTAILAAVVPFVALSFDANPMLFPGILFILAVCVLVFGVLGKPPERRSGLLLTTLILGSLFWALSAKVFLSARLVASRPQCLSNIKQQAMGMLMYATDHDYHFPLAESWHASNTLYVRKEFHCPDAAAPWSYAMNSALSGQPQLGSNHVLLFEADAYLPNASGGREWLVFRHKGTANFGMTDGSAHVYGEEEAAAQSWK